MIGLCHIPGGQTIYDASNFDWAQLHVTFQEDEAEVLDNRPLKGALLYHEVEAVFLEDVKDMHHNFMMWFFGPTTKDEDVVHVDGHNSLIDKLLENVIQHHLEGDATC